MSEKMAKRVQKLKAKVLLAASPNGNQAAGAAPALKLQALIASKPAVAAVMDDVTTAALMRLLREENARLVAQLDATPEDLEEFSP